MEPDGPQITVVATLEEPPQIHELAGGERAYSFTLTHAPLARPEASETDPARWLGLAIRFNVHATGTQVDYMIGQDLKVGDTLEVTGTLTYRLPLPYGTHTHTIINPRVYMIGEPE